MRNIHFNIQFVYGGIEFDVSGFYTLARPAPSIDIVRSENPINVHKVTHDIYIIDEEDIKNLASNKYHEIGKRLS